ncbi:MAG: NAD(P)H-dependent oxidoreductase subunit E [Bdellovibrionaceae bacterium]|jgi:NADH-quinone oxidoreductase subunit E|nr:NAD(P)H-dependent oxidoreductase subunit E [Pseudobdellovibrionaceae bacterium]
MFKLSEEGLAFVKKELTRYEIKNSAIIPCLFQVQKENDNWISDDCISHLAEVMDIPESKINEVFHFYTMFNKKPVGQFHIQVCCNISCAMNGGREIADHIRNTYGVKPGEVSADGQLSVIQVECLGSCGTAPMMQVNDQYYENLTQDSAVETLNKLAK